MKLLSLFAFVSLSMLADALYVDITTYAMTDVVPGHKFFFVANQHAKPEYQYFSTQCGHCDAINPIMDELIKCYKPIEDVYIGICETFTSPFFPIGGQLYWHGDGTTSPLTSTLEIPAFMYGDRDNASSPVLYEGWKDRFSLFQFLEGHLGPCCGPKHQDLCRDKGDKAKWQKLMGKSTEELLGLLDKMKDKEEAAAEVERAAHNVLWHECDKADAEHRLDQKMGADLETRYEDAELARRKTNLGIDSAVGSLRRALDAKGYEVVVEPEELEKRGAEIKFWRLHGLSAAEE